MYPVTRQKDQILTGIIKVWNVHKGYGFVSECSDGGKDVFVHQTSVLVMNNRYRAIPPGTPVQLVYVERNGKPTCSSCTLKSGSPFKGYNSKLEATRVIHGEEAVENPPMKPFNADTALTTMGKQTRSLWMLPEGTKTGVVKWYNEEKGFGFILPDDGGPDVFMHGNQIVGPSNVTEDEDKEKPSLKDGEAVSFCVRNMNGKPRAVNVVRLTDSSFPSYASTSIPYTQAIQGADGQSYYMDPTTAYLWSNQMQSYLAANGYPVQNYQDGSSQNTACMYVSPEWYSQYAAYYQNQGVGVAGHSQATQTNIPEQLSKTSSYPIPESKPPSQQFTSQQSTPQQSILQQSILQQSIFQQSIGNLSQNSVSFPYINTSGTVQTPALSTLPKTTSLSITPSLDPHLMHMFQPQQQVQQQILTFQKQTQTLSKRTQFNGAPTEESYKRKSPSKLQEERAPKAQRILHM